MKSNRPFISCLFICSVVVPISLLSQTVPVTSPISGSSEVCEDESTSYSVNTTLQIVINEVDYNGASGSDVIEIKNIGTTTVDITSWWICSRIRYNQLSSLDIVNGSLNLSSGSLVSLDGLTFDITNDADVGLYATSGFGSSSAMRHFVKFGITTSAVGRETVAVAAGLWTSPSANQYDIVPTENNKTIEFDGSGILSTDWSTATGSLGGENSISTSYNWSVPTGALITEDNGNRITVDWSGAASGTVCVTETNGDGGVGTVDLDVIVNQLMIWYADSDTDGFGDPNTSSVQCSQPVGFILDNTDCDDADITINPDATDTPGSGIDANCDSNYTWYADADGDGFGINTTVSSINSIAGTGESAIDTDCDDGDATINPNGTDTAGSGVDANCDGNYLWYVDSDSDGFGTTATVLILVISFIWYWESGKWPLLLSFTFIMIVC